MKRANNTLARRKEKIGVAIVVLVIAISCTFALLKIIQSSNDIKTLSQFQRKIQAIQLDILFLQKQKSDFLLLLTEQPVNAFYHRYAQLQQRLAQLEQLRSVDFDFNVFRSELDTAKNTFTQLVQLQRQIGLTENVGIRGKMREFVHQAEDLIKNDRLKKQLLQLRRNEKDFIMRHQLSYVDKFTHNLLIFQRDLIEIAPSNQLEIQQAVTSYVRLFHNLVAQNQQRGLAAQKGLRKQLNTQIFELQQTLEQIVTYSENKVTNKLFKLERAFNISLFVFFGVFLVLLVLLARLVNKERWHSLNSRRNLRILTDSMSALVAQSDEQGRFFYFNPLWQDFSGLTIDELSNEAWQSLIHTDDREVWRRSIEKCKLDDKLVRQHVSFELRLKNKLGQYVWFLFHLRSMCEKEASRCYLVLMSMDISEQKLLQQQLDTYAKEKKVINSLLSFPLETYSLEDLLQRSLVICLKGSFLSHAPLGVIFLKTGVGEQSILILQYGLSEQAQQQYKASQYRENIYTQVAKNRTLEYIGCELIEGKGEYQHYALPLLINGSLLGVMSLYLEAGYDVSLVKKKFLQTVATTLSKLIEQKYFCKELQLSHALFEYSNQSLLVCDNESRIIKVNESCIRTLGYSQDELIGSMSDNFQVNARCLKPMCRALKAKGKWQGEISVAHKEGRYIPLWLSVASIKNDAQETYQYVVIATDLTKIKAAEAQVNLLSYYDEITGLAKKTLLDDRLKLAIAEAVRRKSYFCLLVIGVDNYKTVSDTQGHAIGDQLLCKVVQTISELMRSTDTLSRFSGEELVLLLNDLPQSQEDCIRQAKDITENILLRLQEPIVVEQQLIVASISIGISIFPDDRRAISADELIQQASMARHHLKVSDRLGYQVYIDDISKEIKQHLEMESLLRNALIQQEFELYYQPQVDIQSGLIVGAEVLLRWRNNQLGWVSPVDFIPIAEESRQILEIGAWVLRQACLQIVDWSVSGLLGDNFGHIAVNVSPVQFRDKHFIDTLQTILSSTRVPRHMLEIEVTESALQDDVNVVANKLKQLKTLGLFIAIDDFGTGYSSLGRLKKFAIDLIKIDKSFIDDLERGGSDLAIVKAIIAMAEGLGTHILAEGVENERQLALLKEHGCPVYQGYLYSKPVPAKEFMALLQAQR